MLLSTLFFASAVQLATCLTLPPLPGAHNVGTVSVELIDHSRLDPLAPDTRPRDLMISVFYPTSSAPSDTLTPAYTSLFASYFESTYVLPTGSAASILSRAIPSAPVSLSSDARVLLFSPGYSLSRVEYTALTSGVASLGYIVIALDHPFDAAFLDYPDSRTVSNTQASPPTGFATEDYVHLRAADVHFVLDQFTSNASVAELIPGVSGPLSADNVAMFGHSFGGATAADAMVSDERIQCGVNLDGILYSPVTSAGLDRPFVIMAEEIQNRTTRPSWGEFRDASSGFKKEVRVIGALHYGFSDLGFVSQGLVAEGADSVNITDLVEWCGPIEGERMLELLWAYLGDFFEGCFEGTGFGLLEAESAEWPEVDFYNGTG